MGLKPQFIAGMILGCLIMGCAGAVFPYKFYAPAGLDFAKGELLGPDPKGADDIPFTVCAPNASLPVPCIIMKAEDFRTLKIQYLQMQDALTRCQQGASGLETQAL